MTEYIDREAVRNAILGEHPDLHYPSWYANIIDSIPAADVAPVVHGEWIFGEIGPVGCTVKCSACGWGLNSVDPVLWVDYAGHNYCGSCGAKMDGGANE